MVAPKRLCIVLLLFLLLVSWGCSRSSRSLVTSSPNPSVLIKPFLGRWDLTIETPTRDRPSWIEVSDERGHAKVLMVGLTDHAAPLKKVEMKDGELEFLSPKGEEGFSGDTLFAGRVMGSQLAGTATSPNGVSWQWSGQRAPTLQRKAPPKWGKPIRLFNGKNFAGWRFSDPSRAAIWKVEHGMLIKNGNGSEIITTRKFEDFKLHIDFRCGPKANSGVYLRGRYEVQIETDSADQPPSQHTAGIYGFLAPNPEQPRRADVWQSFDITLVGRVVTVVQNGVTVINHQEIPGITGGALDSHEGLPGPIYLQGSEEGRVAFRNIVLTPATQPPTAVQ